MRELHFQSRWFERCLRDYLGIEDRPITEEDVQEIRYLLVSTTHSYELGFAKSQPLAGRVMDTTGTSSFSA